jgi:signal peptidase I
MIPEAHLQTTCCELVADVARNHGTVQLKVSGTSMIPAIFPGDLITVQWRNPEELRTGEVILFKRSGGLRAHRIVQIGREFLVTRGDALRSNDGAILHGEIVGRVESVLRNGRLLSPRASLWRRVAAFVLRHSELCSWLYPRLSPQFRRFSLGGAAVGLGNPVGH